MNRHIILIVFMTVGLCATAQMARQNFGIEQRNIRQYTKTHIPMSQKHAALLQKTERKIPSVQQRDDWWEPDTIVSDAGEIKYREIFRYHKQGLVTTRLTQMNYENSWENYFLDTYSYDGKNIATILSQFWRDDTWVNTDLLTFTYDGNNNMSTMLWQWWDDGFGWMDIAFATYTYEGNNMLTELYQEWNGESWMNIDMTTCSYTGNNLTHVLFQEWEDNWVNSFQVSATYEGENLSESVGQMWEKGKWINLERVLFSYDGSNHLFNELHEMWIEPNWFGYMEYIYSYDGNNNQTEVLIKSWDYDEGWVDEYKIVNHYNADNNTEKIENWIWNIEDKKWEPIYYGSACFYNNMQSELWINAQTATISYINVTQLFVDDLTKNITFSIYPNPVSGNVTISSTVEILQLHIFDITGRLVNSQSPVGNQVDFDSGTLSTGVYLVRVMMKDGEVRTGKLVVK